MPLTKRALNLAADPRSVGLARAWVRDLLLEIERSDLVDSAELGVSELVTNAILHGKPPIRVGFRGTIAHPRIEVLDHAPGPLRPPLTAADNELAIGGRGLAMVAMTASAVGADEDPDGMGKRVWFEPSPNLHPEGDATILFAQSPEIEFSEPDEAPVDALHIEFLNMPPQLFVRQRWHTYDMRREMRLLALTDPDAWPLCVEMSELLEKIEDERHQAVGMAVLNRAIADGVTSIDLVLQVPPSAQQTMSRTLELLPQVYDEFADAHLLNVAPQSPLRELQEWYLGEFVRQAAGERPLPWDGPAAMPSETAESA